MSVCFYVYIRIPMSLFLYLYIYLCTYTYTWIDIDVYLCLYIFPSIHLSLSPYFYICIHICVRIHRRGQRQMIHICVRIHRRGQRQMYIYVCMSSRLHTYCNVPMTISVYISVYVYIDVDRDRCISMSVCLSVYTPIPISLFLYLYTHLCTYKQTWIEINLHLCLYILCLYTYSYICIFISIYTSVHVYMHRYIDVDIRCRCGNRYRGGYRCDCRCRYRYKCGCRCGCRQMPLKKWIQTLGYSDGCAEYNLFHRALLQKRPVCLGSLVIVGTSCSSDRRIDTEIYRNRDATVYVNIYIVDLQKYIQRCSHRHVAMGMQTQRSVHIHVYIAYVHRYTYGYRVAIISRLLKSISLFCKMQSLLQGSFAKETCVFREPANRRHLMQKQGCSDRHIETEIYGNRDATVYSNIYIVYVHKYIQGCIHRDGYIDTEIYRHKDIYTRVYIHTPSDVEMVIWTQGYLHTCVHTHTEIWNRNVQIQIDMQGGFPYHKNYVQMYYIGRRYRSSDVYHRYIIQIGTMYRNISQI